MKNLNSFRKIIKDSFKTEADLERIIMLLKSNGASQIETVKSLYFELKIPLAKADDLVLNSEAWIDHKKLNVNARDKFWGTDKEDVE